MSRESTTANTADSVQSSAESTESTRLLGPPPSYSASTQTTYGSIHHVAHADDAEDVLPDYDAVANDRPPRYSLWRHFRRNLHVQPNGIEHEEEDEIENHREAQWHMGQYSGFAGVESYSWRIHRVQSGDLEGQYAVLPGPNSNRRRQRTLDDLRSEDPDETGVGVCDRDLWRPLATTGTVLLTGYLLINVALLAWDVCRLAIGVGLW